MIDAPPTISPDFYTGGNLVKGVESITDIPVSHLIYSHNHQDHIGAAGVFTKDKDIKIVAQDECAKLLKEAGDPNRPVPNVTFKDEMTLKVGKQTLQLYYRGDIHCPGNTFIYAPDQKILMIVERVFVERLFIYRQGKIAAAFSPPDDFNPRLDWIREISPELVDLNFETECLEGTD